VRVLALELRRSSVRWAFPLLVGVVLVTMFGRGRYWVGVWPQASAMAQLPAAYLGPALAAATAWEGSRATRFDLTPQLGVAVRPRWQSAGAQFVACLSYGLLAYSTGVVAAAALSLAQAGPGFLWWGYIGLGAAVTTGCAAVGFMVGRHAVLTRTAPVLCGLACLIVVAAFGSPATLGLNPLDGPSDLQTRPQAVAARLAVAVALCAVAILVPERRLWQRRWPRPLWGQVAGVVVVAVALSVTIIRVVDQGPVVAPRPPPTRPTCTATRPAFCVWPEEQKYLPELTLMARRLQLIPGTWLQAPAALYEAGLIIGRGRTQDFVILEGSMWSVSPTIAGQVMQASFADVCPSAAQMSDRRAVAMVELGTWLEARVNGAVQPADVHGGPPGVDQVALGMITQRPEAVQQAWVDQRVDVIRHAPCG
jgi:hypothetical protein